MIRMYVRHPVADFARWKQVYDQFDEERKKMGVQGDAVFQAVDDENDVTVWHEFEDEDAAKAFVESDRLRETMEEAGVAGEPTIWYTHRA